MGDISGEWTGQPWPFERDVLDRGWTFNDPDDSSGGSRVWIGKTSTVHQDLVDVKKLEDPFVGFNELKAEWVGERSWTYRIDFSTSGRALAGRKAEIVFEGLDTFATVKLDGHVILRSDNMFLPYRVEVTHLLGLVNSHELEIEFEPALLRARETMAQHPGHRFICSNGEESRLAVRKAQYHWGWDWGPKLMCAGIWRPARLEVYSSRVVDIETRVKLSNGRQMAAVEVMATLEHVRDWEVDIEFTISLRDRCLQKKILSAHKETTAGVAFQVGHPELWMPNGYGQQSLYTVKVLIRDRTARTSRPEYSILHSDSRRIGLREVELVQEPDEHGTSFYFRVNGVDIFCAGSCWIPADSILANMTPERYRAWIELMVPANQKMIRVWGGGVYEDDAFYDTCDELGILVWQDFMFACGNYPTFPSILESIEAEAVANVKRLRHHPSLAIFAGNNEDYQIREDAGLTYDYGDKNEDHWLKSDFPARYIYESLLPGVVRSHAPSTPYHPGSPWGGGKPTSDPTVGDIHQWNVWHGTQEKYQRYPELGGRFNSEFGMEAFPHLATIKSFVDDDRELFPQSRTLDFHNKAAGHERRIATYMVENVRTTTAVTLEAYIHLTQLVQSEAYTAAYRGWRKQWGEGEGQGEGQGRKCGGALVWQFNDCYPVVSWSICDYHLRRKPAYYSIARALAPVAVGIRRDHHDWSVVHAREPKTLGWAVWAVSSTLDTVTADVEIRFVSVESGRDIKPRLLFRDVSISPNGTTDVAGGTVDNGTEEPHVLAARLFVDGAVVARDTDWPQPLKYLRFPGRNIKVDFSGEEGRRRAAVVSAARPVKCLVFEERPGVHLSDSALDVVPGDDQCVLVRGLGPDEPPLTWTYLAESEQ